MTSFANMLTDTFTKKQTVFSTERVYRYFR